MSIVAQTTLAHDVSYNGIGLHAANEVHMVLRPAPADTGIVFIRTDLPGRPSVQAHLTNVTNTMRATTLEKGEAKVFTVEHLLSALNGMEVDNCFVEMDSVEPPVADGSSLTSSSSSKKPGSVTSRHRADRWSSKDSISSRKTINSLPSCPMTVSASPLHRLTRIPCWAYSSWIRPSPRNPMSGTSPLPVPSPLRKNWKCSKIRPGTRAVPSKMSSSMTRRRAYPCPQRR